MDHENTMTKLYGMIEATRAWHERAENIQSWFREGVELGALSEIEKYFDDEVRKLDLMEELLTQVHDDVKDYYLDLKPDTTTTVSGRIEDLMFTEPDDDALLVIPGVDE